MTDDVLHKDHGAGGDAPAAPRTRYVVVTPGGACHPKTGGGQRTRLFFDACVAAGPTDLVLFGAESDEGWLRQEYPGVADVHIWPEVEGFRASSNPVMRKLNALRLLLSPASGYAPQGDFGARLKALARPGETTVFVFRYSMGFCISGLRDDPAAGIRVCVDVDDRDDQKYETYLAQVIGRPLTNAIFRNTSIRAIAERMKAALSRASLVWFAAEEDVWPLGGAVTRIIPNVAMVADDRPELPPASDTTDALFVGSFAHTPNRKGMEWFLKTCWADIAAQAPEARLRIVGMGNWHEIAPLAANLPRVDIVGAVDELPPEYARARITICPVTEGGGSKIKVIESGAYGRAAVVAAHSARGFTPNFIEALEVADGPEALVASCVRLLNDGAAADAAGALLRRRHAEDYARSGIAARIRAHMAELPGVR